MPRKIVPLVTGETYHIYNRGVDKRKIFHEKFDYFRFHTCLQLFNAVDTAGSVYELSFRKDWIKAQKPLVYIHAYCLLNNHFHLLLTQVADEGISEFMKRLGGGYTSYFNEQYERSGALFQGTFKRVHIESHEQLLYLLSYINLNNLVHDHKDYFLSSFDVYTGKRDEPFIHYKHMLDEFANLEDFVDTATKTVREINKRRKADSEYDKSILLE